MHDPFPFAPPESLQNLIRPFAERLSLYTLPLHIHEVACAFLIYHVTNVYVAPALSRRASPSIYSGLNARTKLNWDVHVVSFVQSSLINVMALWVMWTDQERAAMSWEEKIWGYTGASGLIQGFAGGYFLWDLVVTVQNVSVFGAGMLAHAVSALFVFSLGFRPFLNFYGPTFILYELSSPFLNIHWFCDKLNLTGSVFQLINGVLLLTTFFGCRLVWGSYQSVRVFYDVYRAITRGNPMLSDPELGKASFGDADIMRFAGTRPVPVWLGVCYLASNIVLNGLNWFWFGKMIETIRKRFDPPFGTKGTEKPVAEEIFKDVLVEGIDVETDSELANGVTEGKTSATDLGVDATIVEKLDEPGKQTLKVEKTEVRSRRKG